MFILGYEGLILYLKNQNRRTSSHNQLQESPKRKLVKEQRWIGYVATAKNN